MLALKLYLCNTLMKSHTPIITVKNLLRNHGTTIVGVSVTNNHYLKAIVMIQHLNLCFQGSLYTFQEI